MHDNKINVFVFRILASYFAAPYRFVRWLREDVLIVDSNHPEKMPPPRVTLFNNGSLQVKNVKINDSAEYLCEVMTDATGLESQLHAIEVQCKRFTSRIFFLFAQIIIDFLLTKHRSTAHSIAAQRKDRSEIGHRFRNSLRSNWYTATDNHMAHKRKRSNGAQFSTTFDRSAQS